MLAQHSHAITILTPLGGTRPISGPHANGKELNLKKITIVKCALFIATQNDELGDESKDIWHVQAQNKNSGQSSGRVAQTMNCVTV